MSAHICPLCGGTNEYVVVCCTAHLMSQGKGRAGCAAPATGVSTS